MILYNAQTYLAILLIFLVYALHFWRAKTRGSWFLFDPVNVFFAGTFFIYVVEFFSNGYGYIDRHGIQTVNYTLLLISFGLACVAVGYRLPLGKYLYHCYPKPPMKVALWPILLLSLLLFLCGGLSWLSIINASGGIYEWASSARGGVDWAEISGYTNVLTHLSYAGPATLLMVIEAKRTKGAVRWLAWALIAINFIFYLYIGSRSRVILLTLVALASYSLPRQKNIPLWIIVPLGICLLFLVKFIAIYRSYFVNFSFSIGNTSFGEIVQTVVFAGGVSTGAGIGMAPVGSELNLTFAVVELVPHEISYNLGVEFAQLVTHPVPRAVWPEKPYPRGEVWSEIHRVEGSSMHWVEYVNTPFLSGPAPGFIASWYYIGGPIGLVIGGVLVGGLLRSLRIFQIRSKMSEGAAVLSSLLLIVGFSEAVSHPLEWIYRLPFLIVPLFIALKLAKKNSSYNR